MNPRKTNTIIRILLETYPDVQCTLDYDGNDFHFLIRSLLSPQCTDVRVNAVTQKLFLLFPTLESFATAELSAIEQEIKSCGLYHSKAKSIQGTSRKLLADFNGEIPSNRKALESLPGVGGKIANLLLGELFHQPAIVVDTHCTRVANRLGFTQSQKPLQIEKDLAASIPKVHWVKIGHLFVAHGRELCKASSPECMRCPLLKVCTYVKTNE